jgi:hypothetical protein
MPSMKFSLLTGAEVDSSSEAWRHECECRQLARMTTQSRRALHEKIIKKRGESAGDRIQKDVMTLRLMRDLWSKSRDEIDEAWPQINGRYGWDISQRALQCLESKREYDRAHEVPVA